MVQFNPVRQHLRPDQLAQRTLRHRRHGNAITVASDKPYLTPTEAAHELGVSIVTVRRWPPTLCN